MKHTHLLAGTRVEGHYDLIHERDVKLPGEVENALRNIGDCELLDVRKNGYNIPPWWQL